MRNLNRIFILGLLVFNLAGCYDTIAGSTSTDSTDGGTETVSEISPTDFGGASSASNIVTGVQISWVLSTKEASAYKIYRVQGKKRNLLGSVSGQTSSFIDGTVVTGVIYTYLVRAVDSKGVEEQNNKLVQALAWRGIKTVQSSSRTSITINFEAAPVVDEVRIYLKKAGTADPKALVETISGSDLSVVLSNLNVGTKYLVSAQAYVNSLKKEDGNSLEFEIATLTEGFHFDPISALNPAWASVINIRAFGDSPGTQIHPNTPDKQPSARVVELAFNNFIGVPAGREYVVVRTLDDGRDINTQTTTDCKPSVNSSCIVCRLTGTGSTLNCKDVEVAAPPAKYLYTMALKQTDGVSSWVEYFPQESKSSFALKVQIPPENMVLVHRAAANFEMCAVMNKTSDPLNYNRCVYNGIGDRPFSSGHNKPALNLQAGFYDFGYNLFVDRYPMGCKWTRAADGGKCGAGGSTGDCITYGEGWAGDLRPSSSIGVDGNVMAVFQLATNTWRGNNCYMKVNGAWKLPHELFNDFSSSANYFSTMFTNKPGDNDGKIPELDMGSAALYPRAANEICGAMRDPYYGLKRINRMREYRVYSAFPTLSTEPYYIPYTKANFWRSSQTSARNDTNGYGCFERQSVVEPLPTSMSAMLSPTNPISRITVSGKTYGQGAFLGTNYTSDCQSRYGVNGAWVYRIVSDYVTHYGNLSPKRMIGGSSPIDNGNKDLQRDINGLETGFRFELDKYLANGSNDFYSNLNASPTTFISVPMGIPLHLATSTDYLSRATFIEPFDAGFTPSKSDVNSTRTFVQAVGGRWATYGAGLSPWTQSDGWGGDWFSSRIQCVLPAE